jgi:thiamine kinase-like enzyme
VVVRLGNESPEALQIDRESERRALAYAAAAGIGPEVLYCEPAENVLVTRFLVGELWEREDARTMRNIGRLAQIVRDLHALPVPDDVQRIDLAQAIEGYAAELDRLDWTSVENLRAERANMIAAARDLMTSAELRLCHNDIHYLNLIDTGRIRLIDWEYAGVGERLFDLAAIASYHYYAAEERRLLLEHYLGGADAYQWQRLQLACRVFDYIKRLWYAVRAAPKPAQPKSNQNAPASTS